MTHTMMAQFYNVDSRDDGRVSSFTVWTYVTIPCLQSKLTWWYPILRTDMMIPSVTVWNSIYGSIFDNVAMWWHPFYSDYVKFTSVDSRGNALLYSLDSGDDAKFYMVYSLDDAQLLIKVRTHKMMPMQLSKGGLTWWWQVIKVRTYEMMPSY